MHWIALPLDQVQHGIARFIPSLREDVFNDVSGRLYARHGRRERDLVGVIVSLMVGHRVLFLAQSPVQRREIDRRVACVGFEVLIGHVGSIPDAPARRAVHAKAHEFQVCYARVSASHGRVESRKSKVVRCLAVSRLGSVKLG